MRTSKTDLLVREDGITIVEAVVSAAILLVGLLSGFLALDSASDAAKTSERQAVVAAVGQREIERLSAMPWAELKMCPPLPTQAADPDDPRYFVSASGSDFRIMDDYRKPSGPTLAGITGGAEEMVTGTGTCVQAGPSDFTSGGVTGKYYRFITWRDDECLPTLPANLQSLLNSSSLVSGLLATIQNRVGNGTSGLWCLGNEDSKRLTVAVTVDEAGEFGPHHPTWISTIQTDPTAGLLIDVNGPFAF